MTMFFILALGRSGTSFLSQLLTQASGARVLHEPHAYDPHLLGLRYAGCDRVVDGLLERRFRELTKGHPETEIYGEVNSYLRYEARWLTANLSPRLIHLVRDGRDFVRSAYTREVYREEERQLPIVPKDSDPYAARWPDMSRFQKLCWYWRHTNEMLAEQVAHQIRFEDILRDYDAFAEGLLAPTGLVLGADVWRREVANPRNTSRQNRRRQTLRDLLRGQWPRERKPIPKWTEWSAEMLADFDSICGPTMERMGYTK